MQGPAKGLHLARMSYENALMRDEVLRSMDELKMVKWKGCFYSKLPGKVMFLRRFFSIIYIYI